MNTTSDKNELLNSLFKQLDKGSLSPSFRSDLMGRVFAEAAKKRKRAERLGLIAVCCRLVCAGCFGCVGYVVIPKLYFQASPCGSACYHLLSFHCRFGCFVVVCRL